MKRTTFTRLVAVFFLLSAFAGVAAAQTVTGSLVGHVKDTGGGVIPGARVVVTDVDRGTKREAVTNDEGNFSINSVDPGVYRIEIEQTNFKKSIRERVEVAINTTVRADAQLEPGGVTETVEISGEAARLKTDRADVSQQITREQVEELPLSVDRNYQSILDIAPGVTEAQTVGSSFGNPNGSLTNRINGQNERYNNFQLDGTINNQTNVISQSNIVPSPEAIQVVDVSTNAYDAEQGRASGGVVNVQIRSGTNDFHGSVYAFNTNSALRARNTLSTLARPQTKLTQFGATFGGPIRRDKTFFFADYQGGRDRRGQSTLLSVPAEAFRNGDFRGAGAIFDPGPAGTVAAASRQQFADNIIPAARISPVARAILARLPLPNLAGATNNYEAAGTFIQDRDQFDVKINHIFSDSTNGFVRYSFFKANTADAPAFGVLGGLTTSGGATAAAGPSKNQSGTINLTHTLSPSLVTEFRLGFVRVLISAGSPTEEDLATQLGIPGINNGDFFTGGLPFIRISGYTSLGIATTVPFKIAETSYNLVNNWTKTTGNHTLRFGGDIRNLILNKFQAAGSNPRGDFTFSSGLTSRTTGSSANAFAAFLLGLPQTVSRTTVTQPGGYRLRQYFFFAQDRWQANPKLTLNYGLRHEIYPYSAPANPGDQSRYDPAANQVLIAGYGPVDGRLGVKTDFSNFAPRLGIAYRLDDKTVIRTGYGRSYIPLSINTLATQNFGGQTDVTFTGAAAQLPPRDASGNVITISTGIPSVTGVDTSGGVVTPPANVALGVVNPNQKRGYVQSYNLTVERDIYGFVSSIGYVGSRGTRLPGTLNINAAPSGSLTNERPLAKLYGRTSDTLLSDFMLSNSYHSMQARVDRRFKRLGRITAAYTLGKSLDYTDAFSLDDDLDINNNRGPSVFDRRHNLVVSHVVRLPFGRRQALFSKGIPAAIFGGFSVSGVFSARSGTPVDIGNVNLITDPATGRGNRPLGAVARPNVTGTSRILGGLGPGQKFFDTSVFKDPQPGQTGNAGRNSLRGPSYRNYNATLARTFTLSEQFKLQFQASAFNVTNTPHFSNPSGDFTSTAFGESRTTFGERSVRFGLKLTF
ncbi:MAG: TonB-dependent receptor domain-containing protein [Blastocatellia bacterium]